MSKFDCLLWISHRTLFIACANQLLYNLCLIELCATCVKQNTAVKVAIDTCSLSVKQTFSDLVGESAISLIIKFEQVIKPFLVWNIYFTFLFSVVDFTFYRSTVKSNSILLLCHVHVRCSRQDRPATLFKMRLWYRCFPVSFVKFLNKSYLFNFSLKS